MSKVPGLPLYSTQTVLGSASAKVGETGARRLMKVVVYPKSSKTKVEFKNAATDTGTILLTLQAQDDGNTVEYDFTSVGGLMFTTAMFCVVAGSSDALIYIWYD